MIKQWLYIKYDRYLDGIAEVHECWHLLIQFLFILMKYRCHRICFRFANLHTTCQLLHRSKPLPLKGMICYALLKNSSNTVYDLDPRSCAQVLKVDSCGHVNVYSSTWVGSGGHVRFQHVDGNRFHHQGWLGGRCFGICYTVCL